MTYQSEKKAADALTPAVMARVGVTKPSEIQCPREKDGAQTPCVARDGGLAVADDGVCVACGAQPSALLAAIT